jgi:hypothetical protein
VNGGTLAVGANGTNSSRGSAYVDSLVTELPTITPNPASLSFASQDIGTTSPAQTVTLSNNGSGNLTVSGFSFTGANAADFSVFANGCGASVAPGGNCIVKIAFKPTGRSTGSRSASLNILSDAPASPGTVSLTGIAAPPAGGATLYRVYAATTPGGESSTMYASPTTTSYTVRGLTPEQTYYFTVAAVAGAAVGAQSGEISAVPVTPAPPTGLTAAIGSATGTVALQWNASTGATGYKVYEGTTPGGESNTAIAGIATTSYTATGLTSGQTYYFRVAAAANGIHGARTGEVSAAAK